MEMAACCGDLLNKYFLKYFDRMDNFMIPFSKTDFMKTTLSVFLVLLASIAAISCNKKSQATLTGNYLIIGHDGGFVAYVSNYYLITKTGLSKDTTHYDYGKVPTNFRDFKFNYQLPTAQYDTVKDLLTSIPSELLSKNNTDIGGYCPDYGYDDIRASIDGVLYEWKFECDQSGSSAAVQEFFRKIHTDF